jgi:LEA14-like dessication related protein
MVEGLKKPGMEKMAEMVVHISDSNVCLIFNLKYNYDPH